MTAAIIDVRSLTHHYGLRQALDGVDLQVQQGEFFTILGPNGGGKTTLFRVLATLVKPQAGQVLIDDCDLLTHAGQIRAALGVVFQAASLDRKLTVAENLWCQGRLYGMSTANIRSRTNELLARLAIADRAGERVETLSGGLRRRVEICKALLHRPRLLLLDEPTTGLDPLVRHELWRYLAELRTSDGLTVVMTTHFLDEADKADRLAILHQGRVVALDRPAALRDSLPGQSLTLRCREPAAFCEELNNRFQLSAKLVDDAVRVEVDAAQEWIPRLITAWPDRIESVTWGKATLEDVFVSRTGTRFTSNNGETSA